MAKIYLIEQSLTKSIVSRLCPNILTTKGKTNDFTSGDTAVSPAIIHVKRTDEQRCTDGSQTGGYRQKEQMQSGSPDSLLEQEKDTGGNPDVNKACESVNSTVSVSTSQL